MRKGLKYALTGFFFGTVGLYLLAMLSLLSPVFEYIAAPVMFPGKWAAAQYGGPDGSNTEVIILTLFNGVIYGVVFALLGMVLRKKEKSDSEVVLHQTEVL